MDFQFRHTIPDDEKSEHILFYRACRYNAIEQHPCWLPVVDPERSACYFSLKRDGRLTCTAVAEENNKFGIRSANISFGPLFQDRNALVESIDHICNYYKKRRYTFLTVQLGMETGADADYIEYIINRSWRPRYFFDRENWSSLLVDLSIDDDQIHRNFSKGHKSDVKKAAKLGLMVSENFTDEKFEAFISVYIKMHTSRGLKEPLGNASAYLHSVRTFFRQEQAGKFLLVENTEGQVLGGIAVAFQNGTVRYFKGAADPESRNYPVLHAAIAHAIKAAKASGFLYFDLWGYNHFVSEDDQIFHINKFKKGFGGQYIFYPKRMYFIFNGAKFNFISFLQRVYKKYLHKK